jgi:hypothetical protein
MQRKPVISSDLKSVGYDPDSKVLEVEFKSNGSIFRYPNVPLALYEGLMRAQSRGIYFREKIRNFPERYPPQKIK